MSGDMMDTLKDLLGENADEKLRSVMSVLGGGSSDAPSEASASVVEEKAAPPPEKPQSAGINEEALQYIGQFKNVVDSMGRANDSRSRLLMSLKPYMRASRQHSIDNAVRLLNISRLSGLFKL